MIKNMIIDYHWPYVKDFVQNLEKELRNFIRNWPIDVWMLIQIRDQRLVNYMIYLIFGVLNVIRKKKNMDITEEKSKKHLKKLIRRYQIHQSHIKRILMLYILVEP